MHINLPTAEPNSVWVVCLCAQWCGVCRDYRPVFESQTAVFPNCRFAWVDIEDQAELLGDLDIETFPTLLVADDQGLLFLGSCEPQTLSLSRLLQSLLQQTSRSPHSADTQALLAALPAQTALWL